MAFLEGLHYRQVEKAIIMKNAVVQFRSDQVHRKDPQMDKGLRAMDGRPATRSSYVSLRERLSKDSILSRFLFER